MHTLIIENLYEELLACWNKGEARGMASLFTGDACIVGFDGSLYNGSAEFEASLEKIFSHHKVASYVGEIRDLRLLSPDICMLQAVVGMIPPGKSDLDPSKNAIQTVLFQYSDEWKIVLFQNTPAQFHGNPEAAEMLTRELRGLVPVGA